MKLTYDLKYNIGYIKFKEKREDLTTLKVSEDMLIDIASDGTIYGIELLNIKKQLFADNNHDLLLVNENTGVEKQVEMPY